MMRIVQAAPYAYVDIDVSKVYGASIVERVTHISNGVVLGQRPALRILFYDGTHLNAKFEPEQIDEYLRVFDKGNVIDRGRLPRSCIKSFKLNGYWCMRAYYSEEIQNVANEYAGDPHVRDAFPVGGYVIDRYRISSIRAHKTPNDGEYTCIGFENGHEILVIGAASIRNVFQNQIVAFVPVLAADGDHAIAARVASFLIR